MRFHTTPEFAARLTAWRDAYAAHDVFADDDPPRNEDRSAAEESAGKLEYSTLEDFLIAPAFTPTEILRKLEVMRTRDVGAGWTDHYPRYMAQIERDLMEQQRPCVSPGMSQLFDVWREAVRAVNEDHDGSDEHGKHLGDAASAAGLALHAAPCFTPGDFLTKVFVEMLGEHGGTNWGAEPGGFPFEIERRQLGEGLGINDGAAQEAYFRDLHDTDLGCCLMALGRLDFEPAAWLAAADRAGLAVTVVIGPDEGQALWVGMGGAGGGPVQIEREQRVQRLLTGNGGGFGTARSAAVGAYIVANEPSRIARAMACAS
ncbi:hypothetical protein [Sphingomonas sp. Leaf242]|uniref:hypothetical protein n=1 Tax=Sphingomonas sp. Leaf242 TaxID=1736304 RepID=UPI00071409C6|nr:hypothetical protein [Sphingomonas sp. Leaf242]KQO13258.1 hypothetical protein ASF09_03140 [Sphingomonas sp. Leaf242]